MAETYTYAEYVAKFAEPKVQKEYRLGLIDRISGQVIFEETTRDEAKAIAFWDRWIYDWNVEMRFVEVPVAD